MNLSTEKKIIVVGSASIDMITKVSHLPKLGETVMGHDFQTLPGGKGANQAVAAKRTGGNVSFIACLGHDSFGEEAIAGYVRDGIDVSNIVKVQNEQTGIAQIMVDENGCNMISVFPGANAHLSSEKVIAKQHTIQSADIILVQLEIPVESVVTTIQMAHEFKKIVILNPAPARQLPNSILSKLDFIIPNETEAELLTGIKIEQTEDAKRAANLLLAKGIKKVMITLGSKGVYYTDGSTEELFPAYTIQAVDSTAAGDTFCGAFATGLSKGFTIAESVQFAQAAAALSVTKLGAQSSIPSLTEIKTFMQVSHTK